MIKDGILHNTSLNSPIDNASLIRPKGQMIKKALVAGVILTSLIDAFSILVIYLLVNFSNSGEILYLSKDMKLPESAQSEILQRSTLVKIEKGQFFIEEEPINEKDLVSHLVDIKKELVKSQAENSSSLTIQADKKLTYDILNKVVLAGSHAGFGEIKFAVLMN